MFPSNQVRHFYVANQVSDVKVKTTPDGSKFWFTVPNALGETERTDAVDISTACVKVVKAKAMQRAYQQVKVSLSKNINGGTPIIGEDYILRIVIKGFVSGSDEDEYVKFGAVHVTNATKTAAAFYKAMEESLKRQFKRDANKFFEFSSDTTGVTITEVEQPWRLGLMPDVAVHFEVYASTVNDGHEEVLWAEETPETGDATIVRSATNKYAKQGRTIADMEWFYHGERGDKYRGLGYPNNFDTVLVADPNQTYDVLDIHYHWEGANHAVQKSEKDLTIAVKAPADFSTILKEMKITEYTENDGTNVTLKTVAEDTKETS